MSQKRLPPPGPRACLVRPCPSSQKGGTLIAEEVTELTAHQRRVCDPDGYRPERCPRCGHDVLHIHAYRERQVLGEDGPVMRIVIHRCAEQECRATWRSLPKFLARRLWRTWRTVERAVWPEAVTPPQQPPVPRRTVRRWKERRRRGGTWCRCWRRVPARRGRRWPRPWGLRATARRWCRSWRRGKGPRRGRGSLGRRRCCTGSAPACVSCSGRDLAAPPGTPAPVVAIPPFVATGLGYRCGPWTRRTARRRRCDGSRCWGR